MKKIRILSAFVVSLLILTALITPVTASAASVYDKNYDYSKEGSYFNSEKNTADLLTEMLGIEISEEEYTYLDEYGLLGIQYDDVTIQHVSVFMTAEIAEISALPYSYTAKGGSTVTWVPKYAKINDEICNFEYLNGEYFAYFNATDIQEDAVVYVDYELDIEFVFSKDDINEALNLAYRNAPIIKQNFDLACAKRDEHESFCANNKDLIDQYYENVDHYSKYLTDKLLYDEAKTAYNEYLVKVEQYDEQMRLRDEYLVKLEEYNNAVDYNKNFDTYLENYNKDCEKYQVYVENMDTISTQIDTLDAGLFDRVTSLNRQLYSAIFSGLVDTVIQYKALCRLVGIKLSVINDCEKATGILRSILEEYKTLKTDEEKYTFYVNNYEPLRDNIVLLARSLENFFRNTTIRNSVYSGGTIPFTSITIEPKGEQFAIFIAQLILFANALSDEPVYDYNGTKILDKNTTITLNNNQVKNPVEILEDNEYVLDSGNAQPVDGGYPAEMQEPVPPTMMDVPERPVEVLAPIRPDGVSDPGAAPEEVHEPVAPVGYFESMPTEEELNLINNEVYSDLALAYEYGKITEREEVDKDYTYKLSKTLSKKLFSTDTVTIEFMDTDGEIICSVSVDKNSPVSFIGTLPTKEEDIGAYYAFDKWVDEHGNAYDFSNVVEDATLYPSFKPIYKLYETKSINGLSYLFVDVSDKTLDNVPLEYLLSAANESSVGIIVSAKNMSIRLTYSTVLLMISEEVSSLDVKVNTVDASSYTCEVSALDASGEKVDTAISVALSVPCTDAMFGESASVTYRDSDNAITQVSKNYSDGAIHFMAKTGVRYELSLRYSVNVTQSSGLTLGVSTSFAGVGEKVTVSVTGDYVGKELELYYFDSTGKHVIEGNSFVMPAESVTVGFTLTDIEFTIKFISDGKVISIATYKYGEKISVPRNPAKQDDDKYSYTFAGWSSEIEEYAYSDATYTAQFDFEELPSDEVAADDAQNTVKDQVKQGVIIIAIVIAVMLLAAIVVRIF